MAGRDVVYFDTGALAKWYLNESFSADVERYLMEHGPDVPLRTLDAMHLVIAREIDASILATADRIMAAGAHEMVYFRWSVSSGDNPFSPANRLSPASCNHWN